MSKKIGLFFLVIAILVSIILTATLSYAGTNEKSIIINPITNMPDDFIKGVDASMLPEIEKNGGIFYDVNGKKRDCLEILKSHGVNYVRIRIWNDPVLHEDIKDSSGNVLYKKGEGVGGGNNDVKTAISLAKRAKAAGLKVFLDFHYSDFWADPKTQTKPYQWANLSFDDVQKELYNFTKQVLEDMKKNNVTPGMVQIGNELNNGMVWPDGKTWKESSDTTIGGYDGLTALLTQGSKAVREVCGKKTKIVIHLANGGDNALYTRVFDKIVEKKVDFDVIGLSFYPYWHGPMIDLKSNMDKLVDRYKKEVVVAETSYAYTLEDGDNFANVFGAKEELAGSYKSTVQGQATEVRDIMENVCRVKSHKGLGVFYWEPDWIPVKGTGWKIGEGNAWDNQAMFDFKGKALASLDVFKKVSGNQKKIKTIAKEVLASKLTTSLGKKLELPKTVKAIFTDDSIKEVNVTWDKYDETKLDKEGTFSINGTLSGSNLKAVLNVTVDKNVLVNPSFETGDTTGWNITGQTSAASIEKNAANAKVGDNSLHYWYATSFNLNASQTVTGLKNGKYTLTVWSSGGGGEKSNTLYASDFGSTKMTTEIKNTGWNDWHQYTIKDINITNGACTVGIDMAAEAGNWGNIDGFMLTTSDSSSSEPSPTPTTDKIGS